MDEAARSEARRQARVLTVFGAVLAIVVSIGLFVSLPIRGVDYNSLNLFTIILGVVAGIQAIRASNRAGEGLLIADLFLLLAMLPTVYGWVVLLYLPALAFFMFGTAMFLVAG